MKETFFFFFHLYNFMDYMIIPLRTWALRVSYINRTTSYGIPTDLYCSLHLSKLNSSDVTDDVTREHLQLAESIQQTLLEIEEVTDVTARDRLKNVYRLLNLRVLKFSSVTSFIEWVRNFVWNFNGNLWNSAKKFCSYLKIQLIYNF